MSSRPEGARAAAAATHAVSWLDDLPVLWQLLRGAPRGSGTAEQRLDRFYRPQAHAYDRFRERLLPGRADLMRRLPLCPGASVLDLGAGTGGHWAYRPEAPESLGRLEMVDLCRPLQEVAESRYGRLPGVAVVHADAQTYRSDRVFDVVLFSYSLSMMDDWRAAVMNARRHVAPGGVLAVIDFYTLPAIVEDALRPLSAWDRWFWPKWFAHDGVMLRQEILPELESSARRAHLTQGSARLPYLPLLRAPWFSWIGEPAVATVPGGTS